MADALEFATVTPERWPDLARLFERRGGPHHCWCSVWCDLTSDERRSPATKRTALEERVTRGVPVGILAYAGDEPVAWCSVAPRETYRQLGGESYPPGTNVWSVVCFFANRELRGHGISARLLDAACSVAVEAGADVIEGFPVDPDSPSYRFMGVRSTFLAAGFEPTGRVGTRRHAMRRRSPGVASAIRT
ncbi:MAG: GNAT family N-acetyltransferase [Chloroflexi bacterium]|nr:GNAT family N-acetyltransferase [Chloroflexota bacterium]